MFIHDDSPIPPSARNADIFKNKFAWAPFAVESLCRLEDKPYTFLFDFTRLNTKEGLCSIMDELRTELERRGKPIAPERFMFKSEMQKAKGGKHKRSKLTSYWAYSKSGIPLKDNAGDYYEEAMSEMQRLQRWCIGERFLNSFEARIQNGVPQVVRIEHMGSILSRLGDHGAPFLKITLQDESDWPEYDPTQAAASPEV